MFGDGGLAPHTLELLHGKHHDASCLRHRGRLGNASSMIPRQQGLWVINDGLKQPSQRVGQLVLKVVFRVDGDVVLEDVDWIFRTFICWGSLGSLCSWEGDR